MRGAGIGPFSVTLPVIVPPLWTSICWYLKALEGSEGAALTRINDAMTASTTESRLPLLSERLIFKQ